MRVRSYAFADTLDEQEAQLKTNPLIRRFADSRLEMSADPYRPRLHPAVLRAFRSAGSRCSVTLSRNCFDAEVLLLNFSENRRIQGPVINAY